MALSTKSVKEWMERIRVAKNIHKKKVQEPIETYRKYYQGEQWLDARANNSYSDKTVDNVVFSNVAAILPSVLLFNPKIFVRPRNKPRRTMNGVFDTMQASIMLEMLVNYDFAELKVRRQMKMALVDALLGHRGFMQIGYTLETEKFKDGDPKKGMLEEHEFIRAESPFAVRRSPLDVLADPEAKDHHLEDANWIALKWVKEVDDVRNTPTYQNNKRIKPNYTVPVEEMSGIKSLNEEGALLSDVGGVWDRVMGWDVWDRKHHRMMTFVDSVDRPLQDKDWPDWMVEGFPLEVIYFNENPDEPLPVADISIYKPAQDELNRIRSLQLEHIRSISRRKYVARENAIDEAERMKLVEGPDGTVVLVQGDPSTAIVPLRDAAVSQDIHIVAQTLKSNIREESGVSQFEKGVAQKFDTATEPSLIAQGTSIRRQERTGIIEDYIVRVARKIMQVRQATLDTQTIPLTNEQLDLARQAGLDSANKIEKMTGPGGQEALLPWLTMDKADIAGEFDFLVETGSTQPKDEIMQRQDVNALAQMAGANPLINREWATRKWLRAYQLDDDGAMRDPQEVAQEQQAVAEAAMQAEIQKDLPKRQVDLQKTKMKTEQSLEKTAIDSETKLKVAAMQEGTKRETNLVNLVRGNGKGRDRD